MPAGGHDDSNGQNSMRHNHCEEQRHMELKDAKKSSLVELKRVKDLSFSDMKALAAGTDPRIPDPTPTILCACPDNVGPQQTVQKR